VKKLIVFLIVFLFLASFVSACAKPSSETPTQETPAPTSDPSFYLDSDGDGMNDWFEENVAGYDSTIPNNRYVILFSRFDEDPGIYAYDIDEPYQFFTERGKIPSENIIRLYSEEATGPNLKNATEQVAKKADENDIVFLYIQTHGYTIASFSASENNPSGDMIKSYQMIDQWLDEINAKVVIVTIMACGSTEFSFPLKDGPCPRIVFVNSAGEFIGMLGEIPEYAFAADTKYGDNNGYVSIKEIADVLDYDPFWGGDRGRLYQTYDELYAKGRSFVEAEGCSKMSDTSNIASKIYLTDYYYKIDFTPDPPERQPYNWIYYKP